jgi:hypothetical protein
MNLLKRAHEFLIALAHASGRCPSSLFLKKIEVSFDTAPFGWGGFAIIYAGTYDDRAVALKSLRLIDYSARSQCKERIQRVG